MRTCIRVRHDLDGGDMWISGVCKEMRWDVKGGEHYIPKPGYVWYGTCWATTFQSWMEGTRPGWKWDTNIGTRLYVRCKSRGIGRLRMLLHLYIAPGWRSWFRFNRVCVEFRRTSWNLYEFEMLDGWISDAVLWICFGWSWDAILWTWLEVSRHQDGGETQISGPEFSWDMTQMERRDTSRSLAGGEMQILRLGWGWDGTWIELRQPSWDLNTLRLHLGFN